MKDLGDDLRLLIHAGKNLESKHCAQLKVLPALELTLASATMRVRILSRDEGVPADEPEIRVPAPLDVQGAMRKSLQRLLEASTAKPGRRGREDFNPAALDPRDEAKDYYEVRMRLFGLSPRTSFKGPGDRWDSALEYYNEHINPTKRSRPAQMENFRKRICRKELLEPLIETLLDHELELMLEQEQTLLAVSTSTDVISRHWEEKYWWFFRMAGLLNAVWWNVEVAIRIRRKLPFDDMTPYPLVRPDDEEVFPGHTERLAQRYIEDALYSVAVIWRFIRYEGWPTGWANLGFVHIHQMPKLDLSDILTAFKTDFSFSPPDYDWLDLALDDAISGPRWRSAYVPATDEEGSAADFGRQKWLQLPGVHSTFIDRLENDAAGQLVLARFAVLVDTCHCFDNGIPPPDPGSCWHCGMKPTPPEYVIPAGQWKCVFHKLRRKAKLLSDLIEVGWLSLARNEIEWGVGGVPAVDDHVDEP